MPFLTFLNPARGSNAQRGYPSPGTGAQASGKPLPGQRGSTAPLPQPGVQGTRSWRNPLSIESRQRGMPAPENAAQRRWPPFAMSAPFGGSIMTQTRRYDLGAAGFVPNFGTVFANPIGAGVVCRYSLKPSYGPSGQYIHGTIFWASQTIPTSIRVSGLTGPAEMAALLGTVNVQAAVRVG